MVTVHLNIGSNIGDRLAHIGQAIVLIGTKVGTVTAVSTPIESTPWGYKSGNNYQNVGVNIETALQPEELLDMLQQIEREISPLPHRNPDGTYRDRVIDIDIIFYGTLTIDTPRLVIPHPHAREREFVMKPVQEIWSTGSESTCDQSQQESHPSCQYPT